jgi:hypothetical protein
LLPIEETTNIRRHISPGKPNAKSQRELNKTDEDHVDFI